MTIIICDDDRKDLTALRTYIERFAVRQNVELDIIEVNHLRGIDDLAVVMEQQTVSAIFLDIDMPYITGDMVAEKMTEKYPEIKIIFFTNRDELVYDMIRYKPFRFIRKRCPDEIEDALMALTQDLIDTGYILVMKTRTESERIPVSEIYFIEVSMHKMVYHMANDSICVRGSMLKCSQELENYGFLRVHNAYMINIRHIVNISKKEVRLKNGIILPVGRIYKEDMMRNYKMILERLEYGRSY